MLDPLVGAVEVVADRGADPGHLAGGDRGADARAADEDAALGPALLDRLADLARLVRVVDAHGVGVGAEVDHLVPGERLEHGFAQVDAAVVERDRDLHRTSTRAILPSSNVKRIGQRAPVGLDARDRVAVAGAPRSPSIVHRGQLALERRTPARRSRRTP